MQQRIVAVNEEAKRKYDNLVESIPARVQHFIKKPEPSKIHEQEEEEEEDPNLCAN